MRTLRTMVLGLGLLAAALPAAERADKALDRVLAADPCAAACLGIKAGDRYEFRRFDAEDLEARFFLVLRKEGRRVLLDLRRDKDGLEVVERRAWVLRNGQRRLLTEADGFAACETRLGSPLRRLEEALDRAEGKGSWVRGRWPAAPPAPKAAGTRKRTKASNARR
jgi:hypothetical protein